MPPTITVETGAGVPGANAFIDAAGVVAYCADRGISLGTSTPDEIASALLRTSDYLRNTTRFNYRGVLVAYNQSMPFPREGCSYRDGPTIPNNVVPIELPQAQCELVVLALKGDLQPVQTRDQHLKSKRIEGAISKEWFEAAPAESVVVVVMGLLASLLRTTTDDLHTPYMPAAADEPAFQDDRFTFPFSPLLP